MLKHLFGLGLLVAFWLLFFTWLHDIYGMPGQSPGHAAAHYVMLLAGAVVALAVLALTLVLFRKRLRRLIPVGLGARWRRAIILTDPDDLTGRKHDREVPRAGS